MDLSHFRPNVGIVLARPDGRVWLGRRADTPGPANWQFPQGGVDEDEALLDAALRELREETGAVSLRELREETGAVSVALLGRTEDWIAYAFPPEHKGSKAARGWLGQKQVWFAFGFLGDDREIDLGGHPEVEFDAWRWASLDEALTGVVAFKRATYRTVIGTFRPLIGRFNAA